MKYKKISIMVACAVLTGGLWYISTQTTQTAQNIHDRLMDTEGDNTVSDVPKDATTYFTHPFKNFSFTYDSGYTLSRFQDGSGEMILLQKEGSGIQVYNTQFTAGGSLSASRIRKEIGDEVTYAQDIEMPAGFKAVTFSTGSSKGEVWDVWFVKDKVLYQVTAEAGHDNLLKQIVETWSFE